MSILWLATGVSLLISLVALVGVRRARKRLEALTQSYWELRYQHGELRAWMNQTSQPTVPSVETAVVTSRSASAFVPLSAVRR